MANLYLLTLTLLAAAASASNFLSKSQLLQEEIKELLLAELAGRSDTARLAQIQHDLAPMFAALPKSETGRLEQSTVRYALHRYFLHKYGWYVQGLDSAGEAWNSSGTSTVLKAFAPMYIQSLFEEHLHGHGMGLHELAVFAATYADLIHAEVVGKLQDIFTTMRLSTMGSITNDDADMALDTFITALLSMIEVDVTNATDIEISKELMVLAYPNLEETKMWWQDFRLTYDAEQSSRRNPFVKQESNFDNVAELAVEFGHRFASFQNLECHTLKRKLVDMEHLGTGRVLLAQFYAKALDGAWEFMEPVEYLRNQGALDESVPDSPAIIIPNYLNSRMNCLTASDYYAVCCLNECDELMGKIESKIMAPSGMPPRIIDVVSKLQSDTVDAPRNISDTLVTRLGEIAHNHGGSVPLHGRLFNQWMHHAYPRECPYPHVSGTIKPMYPEEWAMAMGVDAVEVSEKVMVAHVSRLQHATEKFSADLPWTYHEELVAEHRHGVFAQHDGSKPKSSLLKPAMALVGLLSFAIPLVRGFRTVFASSTSSKSENFLV